MEVVAISENPETQDSGEPYARMSSQIAEFTRLSGAVHDQVTGIMAVTRMAQHVVDGLPTARLHTQAQALFEDLGLDGTRGAVGAAARLGAVTDGPYERTSARIAEFHALSDATRDQAGGVINLLGRTGAVADALARTGVQPLMDDAASISKVAGLAEQYSTKALGIDALTKTLGAAGAAARLGAVTDGPYERTSARIAEFHALSDATRDQAGGVINLLGRTGAVADALARTGVQPLMDDAASISKVAGLAEQYSTKALGIDALTKTLGAAGAAARLGAVTDGPYERTSARIAEFHALSDATRDRIDGILPISRIANQVRGSLPGAPIYPEARALLDNLAPLRPSAPVDADSGRQADVVETDMRPLLGSDLLKRNGWSQRPGGLWLPPTADAVAAMASLLTALLLVAWFLGEANRTDVVLADENHLGLLNEALGLIGTSGVVFCAVRWLVRQLMPRNDDETPPAPDGDSS